jgi:biopolymer transport protein ExbB
MFDGVIHLVDKGGMPMVLLLALSVYALGVILLKAWQFYQARIWSSPVGEEVLLLLEAGEAAKAKRHAKADLSPMGMLLFHMMHTIQNERLTPVKRHGEIQRVGQSILSRLEAHLRGLEFAALVAPLLGLVGTVSGMIKTFAALQAAGGRVDIAVLSGGIWEALLATIVGLAIAVLATAAYTVFDSIIERFRAEMKDVSTRLLEFDALLAETEQTGDQKKPTAAMHVLPVRVTPQQARARAVR